jgi:hypothetical protein
MSFLEKKIAGFQGQSIGRDAGYMAGPIIATDWLAISER